MKLSASLTTALLVAATVGCGTRAAPPPPPPALVEHTMTDLPNQHPDLGSLQISSRGTRRLSVDQLERSLDQIGNAPAGTIQLPANLAMTLGRPDYLHVTEEGLDPTPLYMKFMMDLGNIVCTDFSNYDPGRPVDQRVLTRYPDQEENIRYILLRFTGIEGDAATPYVTRLQSVYARGAQSATRPNGGYEAVCLAVFTSPEFQLY